MDLTLVPGRVCGSCTACCTTHSVSTEDFEKPLGQWCRHCRREKGCAIYATRPIPCKEFRCEWLKGSGEEKDRPDRSGVVLDYVKNPDGPANGVLQIWEYKPGKLNGRLAALWHQYAVLLGISVIHAYLSGRKVFFETSSELPEGFREDLLEEGFEIQALL